MDILNNNTRYILELKRNALIEEKYVFDEKYGTFSFAFLASLEALALLAYLYIATVLIYNKETRTKTNFIVSVWAIINFAVLLEKLSREFATLIGDDFLISKDVTHISDMISGIGRLYGSLLSVIWLCSKYFSTPRSYNFLMHFLISLPIIITLYYIYHYFALNTFIYEVYAPGCDIINVTIYITVGLVFILCKIFLKPSEKSTNYALLIALTNLITNLPKSLLTIYLRFNLDISWEYQFHVYFVDFCIEVLSCCNAFIVLFLVKLYNKTVCKNRATKNDSEGVKNLEFAPELLKITTDCYC